MILSVILPSSSGTFLRNDKANLKNLKWRLFTHKLLIIIVGCLCVPEITFHGADVMCLLFLGTKIHTEPFSITFNFTEHPNVN